MAKDTHNRKVKELANQLKKENWNVKAHVSGYETPDSIGKNNFIPDIVATKGGKTKIIEVDTPRTENSEQLAAFQRSAAHQKNATFEQVITTPRKKKN